MVDYSAMPPRMYRLYHDKSKEISSLRTDDIKGAQPRRFNYAKGDILDKYNNARSQVSVSQEPKNFMFWSPPETKRDEITTKPNQLPYAAPYNAHRQSYDNPYGRDSRSTQPYQSPQLAGQYPDKYANVNNQNRNPMLPNYNQASNRNVAPIQTGNRYQDSLDALNNQYGGKSATVLPSHFDQEKFNNNLHKFFGVDPTAPKQISKSAGVRESQYGVRSSATLTPPPHFDQEKFHQNLHKFFGVEPTAPRQVNNTNNTNMRASQPIQTTAPQNSIMATDQFKKNQHLFFGVEPQQGSKSQVVPRNTQNYASPTYSNQSYSKQNYSNSQTYATSNQHYGSNQIQSSEQFKKNHNLFFGVEEPKQGSRPQVAQSNNNQNYYGNQSYSNQNGGRNPLGAGNVPTQRPPVNNYSMPQMRNVQDEWKFKKNQELFFA